MEPRNVVPKDPTPTAKPKAENSDEIFELGSEVGGERLRSRLEVGTSLPCFEDAASALPRRESVPASGTSRRFAGYRLSFSCDLEILDELH